MANPTKTALTVLSAVLMMTFCADALSRSASARLRFARQHACPSTGLFKTSCPGYVIDHIVPICIGGPDAPENMQWQEYRESLRKDAEERRMCRRAKQNSRP